MEQLGAPSKCLWSCQGGCGCSLCPLHEQAGICEYLLWSDPRRTFLGPRDACYPSQYQLDPSDPPVAPGKPPVIRADAARDLWWLQKRMMVICQADPSFKELQGWTDCVCTDCRLCLVPHFSLTFKRTDHLRPFHTFLHKRMRLWFS